MDTKTITYTFDSPEVQALCAADKRLVLVIRHYGGLTYTPHRNPFAHTVENIVGQMLSSKAGDAIVARLYALCDGKLTPDTILRLDVPTMRGCGLSARKAEYILTVARLITGRPGFFDALADLSDDEVAKELTSIYGLGMWSAKMYLIFVLDRPDVLPYEDGAFLQAYKWLYADDDVRPAAIRERCASWSPNSSIAARYMYRALDEGLTRHAGLGEALAGL